MNAMQKYVVVLGWIVLVGIILCPPWDEGEWKSRANLQEPYHVKPGPENLYSDVDYRDIPGTGYDVVHPRHFDRFKFLFAPPSYSYFVPVPHGAVIDWQILIMEMILLGAVVGGALLLAKGRPDLAPSELAKALAFLGGCGFFILWCYLAFW